MLLRAVQERRYRPIGVKEGKAAGVRIVAETNEDLQKAVTGKHFREDLLYRLKEYTITVPPLRDCQEDIMPLAEFFLELSNKDLERNIKGFSTSARKTLLTYPWPGNIRELKQKIQVTALHTEVDVITNEDLELGSDELLPSSPVNFAQRNDAEDKERILRALKQGKVAAELLGIGRSTLYSKLEKYGLKYKFRQT